MQHKCSGWGCGIAKCDIHMLCNLFITGQHLSEGINQKQKPCVHLYVAPFLAMQSRDQEVTNKRESV
jgi:hypothetical protein